MRTLSSCVALLLLSCQVVAQVISTVQPEWITPSGKHDHTSRDALFFMEKDQEENIILAGQVERDSSFADVVVQKLDRSGQLQWSYRYSSGTELDYDTPLAFFLNNEGAIYLFTSVGNRRSTYGRASLLKISRDGHLLWKKDFHDLLPYYVEFDFYYAFLDSQQQVKVLYAAQKETGSIITHFLTFAPDGTLIEEFSKNDLIQSAGFTAFPVHFYHDEADHFMIFLQRNLSNKYISQIRKINHITDVYIEIPVTRLPGSDFRFLDWEFLEHDAAGNIYAVDNIGLEEPKLGFQLLKLAPDGNLQYIYNQGGVQAADLSGVERFIAKDSNLIVTGRYKPQRNPDIPYQTFIIQLDSRGKRLHHVILSAPQGDLVPQGLFKVRDKFYLTINYLQSGRSRLLELNDTLGVAKEFELNYDVDYSFDDVNVIPIGEDTLLAGGTISKAKFENASYLSEQEFYVEAFSADSIHYYWQYEYNDLGTSYVQLRQIYLDHTGHSIVLTSEKGGPDCLGCTLAPVKYYLQKYNKDGQLLWDIPLPNYYIDDYNQTIFFDTDNNIYLKCRTDRNFALVKFSPDGVELNKKTYTFGIENLFIDRQNRLFLPAGLGIHSYANNVLFQLDTELETVRQTNLGRGRVLGIFQLPNDDALYYYVFLPGPEGISTISTMSLYKDRQLQWQKSFEMSNFYMGGGLVFWTHHQKDGTLIMYSNWSQSNRWVHRFTLSGNYSRLDLPPGIETVQNISIVGDDAVFIQNGDSLYIYHADLTLKRVIYIPDEQIYSPRLVAGDFYIRIKDDSLSVFDVNGNQLGILYHPHIDVGFWQYALDPHYNLYTATSIGGALPLGFNAPGAYLSGWRWSQGIVAKFALAEYLDFVVAASSVQKNTVDDINITVFPNPTQDFLNIAIKISKITPKADLLLQVIDLSGKIVQESRHAFTNFFQLSVIDLPPGFYSLKLTPLQSNNRQRLFTRFIKSQ